MRVLYALLCVAALLSACSPPPERAPDGSDITPEAVRQLYERYEAALRAQRADTLAAFYRPAGARIIMNGIAMDLSNADLDSIYRGSWEGPSDFAFDDLRFEQISPAQVLVTGGFRWLLPQSVDTMHFIYLAIIEQTEVGPRIRLEHETLRPDAPASPPDSAGVGEC